MSLVKALSILGWLLGCLSKSSNKMLPGSRQNDVFHPLEADLPTEIGLSGKD